MERKEDGFQEPVDVEQNDEDGDHTGRSQENRNIKMSVSHAKIAGMVSKKRDDVCNEIEKTTVVHDHIRNALGRYP